MLEALFIFCVVVVVIAGVAATVIERRFLPDEVRGQQWYRPVPAGVSASPEPSGRPQGGRASKVALALVRVWLAVMVVALPLSLVDFFGEGLRLGDRVEFQEFGYSYPGEDREPVWHDGPWLYLRGDAPVRLCSAKAAPGFNEQPRPVNAAEPAWFDSPSACRTAREVREAFGTVDVEQAGLVRIVEAPPASVKTRLRLLAVAGYAFFLLAGFALERILRLTAQRRPFSPRAVTWLRVLAGGVAGVTILVPFLEERYADSLMREFLPAASGATSVGINIGFGPWFVVLLILVLAQVWRYGIRLQEDAEATV